MGQNVLELKGHVRNRVTVADWLDGSRALGWLQLTHSLIRIILVVRLPNKSQIILFKTFVNRNEDNVNAQTFLFYSKKKGGGA